MKCVDCKEQACRGKEGEKQRRANTCDAKFLYLGKSWFLRMPLHAAEPLNALGD